VWWLSNTQWTASGLGNNCTVNKNHMLATWVELALVFQIQTGVRLAPDSLDLRSQETIFRSIVKRIWSKTAFKLKGIRATAKQVWQPVTWSTACKPLIDHSRSGICRRPIISNDIWKTVAGILHSAHQAGKSSDSFGVYRRVCIKTQMVAQWKPAVLRDFNDAIAKAVKAQTTQDAVPDEALEPEHQIGPCHFGHLNSSQRVNGREAWLKNPPVSWWPGFALEV